MFESHISISFFRARSLCAENQSCWCKSSRKELMKHFSMEKSTYMCALHARSVSRPLMLFFNGISLSIIHYYCQVLSSMRCCCFFLLRKFFFSSHCIYTKFNPSAFCTFIHKHNSLAKTIYQIFYHFSMNHTHTHTPLTSIHSYSSID